VTAAALVEPAYCTHPPYDRTLGPEVADLAELAGFTPDAEQRLALDLIFAFTPAGPSSAFEVALAVGRQNLKTGLAKMAALGWLYITDQRLVVWSAHEFNTSAEAFRDMKELIEGCPWLDRRIRSIKGGHGDESIELAGGQRLVFKTRTKGGGRGLSGDKVVLDEAMFLQPMHMGALLPTLSARPDPQVLYCGSAGLAESSVWRSVRNRGRAGGDPRLAFLEWCDDLPGECETPGCTHRLGLPGCRLDDEARWGRANPAMNRVRVFDGVPTKILTSEYIAGERRALPPEEFGRERLGWWDDPDEDLEELLALWVDCADVTSAPSAPPVYAIDVSPNSRSAAIVAAMYRDDDLPHVEVVDHHAGVGWVVDRCVELTKHSPLEWVLDPAGPAGALLPDLAMVGIEPKPLTTREMGQACEAMASAVRAKEVRHLGDPLLMQALGGAGRRDVGDGLWMWSRRRSDADIAPLYAATEALWVLVSSQELAPDDIGIYVF